ncbi:MAG: SGNH/GDSL hydrolase family protein [Blastococcus sp.]
MRPRLAASVVAATVAVGVVATAPASQAAPAPLRYVALGDSYSAASGNVPPDPTAAPQCLRSTANYPHDIAGAIGAQLADVTCGAADTSDYFTAQYNGVPPQLAALRADTQLVTMTIGGNDSNVFIDSIVECGTAGASTAGQGSPCKDKYGSSFEDTIRNTTYPSLVRALKAVHAKSPTAKVAILGYPWILPPTVGCFDKMPIATGDVPYLHHEEWTLNDAVRRAAAATGSTYVDMNTVSTGHDACQPIGTRWIEPVTQGTNPVIVHPNALGETHMATQARKVLGLG